MNKPKKTVIKILLFKTGAIGDTIMTTPLLRQLREHFPRAEIDYLIGDIASQALEDNPHIDNIMKFNPDIFFKRKIFAYLKLIKNIRKRKYDCIFVLDKHHIFNYTSALFHIPIRIGFDRMGKEGTKLTNKVYFDGTRHEIYYYLDLLKACGKKPDYKDIQTEISLSSKDLAYARDIIKKYKINKRIIVISPGGANNPGQKALSKTWPKENYRELVSLLKNDYKIIFIGDKNDKQLCDYISKDNPGIINLCGKTAIKQAAAIMKHAYKIITNDSGSMHIATCVNNNIIALFGPTDPKRFAPITKNGKCLWKSKKVLNDIYGNFSEDNQKNIGKISVRDVIKCI